MKTYDHVIIGGGIAGTTAAEVLRQGDPDATIAIISDEPHRLYSRVMLSKPQFFLGQIPVDTIWLKTEEWYTEQKIDFLGGKMATALDPAKKTVTIDGEDVGYGKILLASGTRCRKLPIGGADKDGVFHVKTIDDALGIIGHVKSSKRAVVVGAGFISFEMCDMLHLAGLEVTAVVREPYFWDPQLDEESGRYVEGLMKEAGITIMLENELQEIRGEEKVAGVTCKDGTSIDCEMVIFGVGSCLDVGWLEGSGVEVGHGVATDAKLHTSVPDVYAAGDTAWFDDLILGGKTMAGTWVNAQVQGRIAAKNMLGGEEEFKMLSYYTAHGFGKSITFAGDVAVREGRIVVRRGSHEDGSFSHYIVHENKIIGATFVNRGNELAAALKLISGHVDVSEKLEALADPETDPLSLMPSQT